MFRRRMRHERPEPVRSGVIGACWAVMMAGLGGVIIVAVLATRQ